MNKSLILIFFILLSPFILSSQLNFDGGIKFGGITSQVHGDTYAGFHKIGISGGFFTEIDNGGDGSVSLEILYSRKGSRNEADTLNIDFFKLELNYIEIPITFQYQFNVIKAEAGLYYGYLLSSSSDFGNGPGEVQPPFNNYDIGGHVGASYDIVEDKFFVNVRLSNSILSTRKAPEISTQPGVRWDGGGFNTAIHMYLGLKF